MSNFDSKFDLAKTQILQQLFAVDPERRDDAWRERFYAAVPDASLVAFEPQVEFGPDEFPYFHLAVPEPGPLTPFCVTHALDYCLEHGCGIAVFADARRAGPPAWVFSYGDLLSYRLYGRFDGDPSGLDVPAKVPADPDAERTILRGSPSETYLPACARKAIGRFFRDTLKHPDPRITLIADAQSNPMRRLMVNLTPDHYGGEADKVRAALHYTSWFLPATYRVVSMPPEWSDSDFLPLV